MTSRRPPTEGDLERWARRIVSEDLGVPVTMYDDNSRDRMPDALIHLPIGEVPLEVVSDTDSDYEAQWRTLRKKGSIFKTDLPGSWIVFLNNRGHVGRLQRELPKILATWPPKREPWEDVTLSDELAALGVAGVHETKSDVPGSILLTHEGWNSWDDPIQLNEWVTRVLTANPDVAGKLELYGGVQRHAFIWAMPSSAYAVNSILADDDDDQTLPLAGPPLPEGITHLWVASVVTRRGCLVLEDGGWRRTDWVTVEMD